MLNRLRIRFDETMSGTHTFLHGPQAGISLPFSFHIDCTGTGLADYFDFFDEDFLSHEIQGTVHASGLATASVLEGKLVLRYFRQQKIFYDFEFQADDGRSLRFFGEKRGIYPWTLPWAHFRLYGAISDPKSNETISTVEARFAYSDLPSYVKGFRLIMA